MLFRSLFLQETVKKSLAADYENQLKLLQQKAVESEEKLKESRKKELEFLQKEQALKAKEEEIQITIQRQLLEERAKLKEQLLVMVILLPIIMW